MGAPVCFLRRRRDSEPEFAFPYGFTIIFFSIANDLIFASQKNETAPTATLLNKIKSTCFTQVLFVAEKERFELSRRLTRPTPLAGAPLHQLEYFSNCRRPTLYHKINLLTIGKL